MNFSDIRTQCCNLRSHTISH